MKKISIFSIMSLTAILFVGCADNDITAIDNTIESEVSVPTEEFVAEEVAEVVEEVAGSADEGSVIFTDNACAVCHAPDTKTVGPSLMDISKAYEGNSAGMISFLKEEADAIVDPAMFAVMKANLAITKEMDDKSLNDLAAFILSH